MSDFIKIIKMQQLKQVIKSRIKDIKQLQQTNFINIPPKLTSSSTSVSNSSHSACSPSTKNIQRYELILKQRNGQQYRNSRQIVMLSIANGCGFNLTYQQLENVVFQVCVAYEAGLERDSSCTDPKERIYRLLRGFFTRNGFKQKLGHLKTIFNRSCSMSVGLIFTLFSQWSKKQYLNALSAQVKQIKSRYLSQPIPQSPSNDKLPQTLQLEASIKSQKSVSSITLNINSVRSEPIQRQKPKNITNLNLNLNLNTKMNMNSDSNNSGFNKLINSTNKIGSVGCVNSGKLLTIYNRSTLYGFFIQDLESYYQLTGMEGLDKGFIKSIGKRKMKENLVFVQNMNRAIQVLIQCSNNKQQRSIIRDYSQNYNHHKQAQPMPKMKKSNPNPLPSLSPYRIDLNHTKVLNTNINMKANIRNVGDNLSDNDVTKCSEDENYSHNQNGNNKKFSVDSGCAQFRDRDQSVCGLSKNMSSALLGPGEESEGILNNIRENIKKKLIYRTVQQNQSANPKNLNRIKFPSLSRSMQKKQKVALIQKSKLYRFPTQQEQAVQSKAEDQSSELFKFSQRQTIKGIIIKNFLSVRQKQKNKKNKQESQMNNLSIRNKQEECSARKNHLKIESEEREQQCKEKEWQKQKQKQKKNIEAVDIRSLRQKTKALLKNYKVMQNY